MPISKNFRCRFSFFGRSGNSCTFHFSAPILNKAIFAGHSFHSSEFNGGSFGPGWHPKPRKPEPQTTSVGGVRKRSSHVQGFLPKMRCVAERETTQYPAMQTFVEPRPQVRHRRNSNSRYVHTFPHCPHPRDFVITCTCIGPNWILACCN